MPLSWNEIKSRAAGFSKEWSNTSREEAEAKPFLTDFLNIFGISRKRVATFEHRVKKLDDASGYIDLLWPGTLLVEMKSRGQDLKKAYEQARAYCHGLKDYELPQLILICDFQVFHIYREDGLFVEFELPDLINHLNVFEELAGYQKRSYHDEDPVNIAAAELMGKLHDELKAVGYTGAHLEVYLVRLVFILFADDSTIFQKGIFLDYLELRTREDGSDLAMHLDQLFQVLDTPEQSRLKTLDEQLNLFPYVNGRLFSERLPNAAFNTQMRQILLDCCKLDWAKISPAIFGSLFQSVMDATARRNLGAHYTSEKNILKVIKPLFVDDLWEEFHAAGENQNKLRALHHKISKLRFLDPACGCGNFLITAFRELRLVELAIAEKLLRGQPLININMFFMVDLDQFYGIEIGEFPSHIAQVAMWLIDHQMNMLVSEKFGEYIPLIPLLKSAIIVNANALRIDWQSIIKPLEGENETPRFHYIMGNPPFVGKTYQTPSQKEDLSLVLQGVQNLSSLDYVAGWFLKSATYINSSSTLHRPARVAFVSTNSICQGEQVSILWRELFSKYRCKIHYAYRPLRWTNEAKGVAGVHVVIIGFSNFDISRKLIFSNDDNTPQLVTNISPYLLEGSESFISRRSKPICNVPPMIWGNKPVDGGNLIVEEEDYEDLVNKTPLVKPHIKRLMGGEEFIKNKRRWCLWLVDIQPHDLKEMPLILERIEKVRKTRLSSIDAGAQKLASTPTLFRDQLNPNTYIAIPEVSSERRIYIPTGFLDHSVIPTNTLQIIPDATLFHLGIITSTMHMSWVRYTCGRLESRYRYSNSLVYNNYPWPEAPSDKQKQAVEAAAQLVIDVRAQFPDSSLADLYDPNTMPPALVKAHQQLDKIVDNCYRPQPFTSEAKRIEYLFELYEKYTSGLFVTEKASKRRNIKEKKE